MQHATPVATLQSISVAFLWSNLFVGSSLGHWIFRVFFDQLYDRISVFKFTDNLRT